MTSIILPAPSTNWQHKLLTLSFLFSIFIFLDIWLLKVNRFVASNATVAQIQDVRRKSCQHIYRSTVRKHRKLKKESNTRYAVKRCNLLKFRSMEVSAVSDNEKLTFNLQSNRFIVFIVFNTSSGNLLSGHHLQLLGPKMNFALHCWAMIII